MRINISFMILIGYIVVADEEHKVITRRGVLDSDDQCNCAKRIRRADSIFSNYFAYDWAAPYINKVDRHYGKGQQKYFHTFAPCADELKNEFEECGDNGNCDEWYLRLKNSDELFPKPEDDEDQNPPLSFPLAIMVDGFNFNLRDCAYLCSNRWLDRNEFSFTPGIKEWRHGHYQDWRDRGSWKDWKTGETVSWRDFRKQGELDDWTWKTFWEDENICPEEFRWDDDPLIPTDANDRVDSEDPPTTEPTTTITQQPWTKDYERKNPWIRDSVDRDESGGCVCHYYREIYDLEGNSSPAVDEGEVDGRIEESGEENPQDETNNENGVSHLRQNKFMVFIGFFIGVFIS